MNKFRPINTTDVPRIWEHMLQSERDDITHLEERLIQAENLVRHLNRRLYEEKEHAVNGWEWVEGTRCGDDSGQRCVVFVETWTEWSDEHGDHVDVEKRDAECASCGQPV